MKLYLAQKFLEIVPTAEFHQFENEDCYLIVTDIGKVLTAVIDNNSVFTENKVRSIGKVINPLQVTFNSDTNKYTIK